MRVSTSQPPACVQEQGDATRFRRALAVSTVRVLRSAARRVVAFVRLWREDRAAIRDCAQFLGMPEHVLRDIGLPHHTVFEIAARERLARRGQS